MQTGEQNHDSSMLLMVNIFQKKSHQPSFGMHIQRDRLLRGKKVTVLAYITAIKQTQILPTSFMHLDECLMSFKAVFLAMLRLQLCLGQTLRSL